MHPAALSRTAQPYPGQPLISGHLGEPVSHRRAGQTRTSCAAGDSGVLRVSGGPCLGGTRRCRGCTISLSGYPFMPTVGLTPGGRAVVSLSAEALTLSAPWRRVPRSDGAGPGSRAAGPMGPG